MCIGVPMRVASEGGARAWCESRDERVELDSLSLTVKRRSGSTYGISSVMMVSSTTRL